ncbi:MAG: hypothetical protein LAO24_23625 [Acidobacteriia bacterium]|nr:hypothetical protein [Terriglobia bacterium]
MKRISMLAAIVCACLTPVAWAQQRAATPQMFKHAGPKNLTIRLKHNFRLMSPRSAGTAVTAQDNTIYDLGHYPEGSWAQLGAINDLGVATGWGDVAGGDIRVLGVPIFGPNAGQWFETGVSTAQDQAGEGGGITLFGMIIGYMTGDNGYPRAYAWTGNHQTTFDLGPLPGDDGSAAIAVNHLGTLIVGFSVRGLSNDPNGLTIWLSPVVWTPKFESHKSQQTLAWKIQALPMGGFEKPGKVFKNVILNNWGGWGANDLGQIVGDAWSDNFDEIAVIWTPTLRGGWKIERLPYKSAVADYPYTEALAINNRGEIVGDYWECTEEACTALPALWKVKAVGARPGPLTVLATLSGLPQGWNVAWGINDIGDVVGVSNDADWNWLATRWKTKDPSTAMVLGFPGDWSTGFAVNNFGIAVGTYGVGDNPEQAAAVAIH